MTEYAAVACTLTMTLTIIHIRTAPTAAQRWTEKIYDYTHRHNPIPHHSVDSISCADSSGEVRHERR